MKIGKVSVIVVSAVLMSLIGATTLLFGPSCGSQPDVGKQQGSETNSRTTPTVSGAPAKALFGQIYHSTTDNREYIYDGAAWVPHDKGVDDPEWQPKPAAIGVMKTAFIQPPCSPTGAHGGHAVFDCKTCHLVGGVVCFDPAGKAVAAGKPAPTYDPASKTCSNVACHGVSSGTFSFYTQGGDGEAYLNTVTVYGSAIKTTPSWYDTGISCGACHDDPPRNGTDGSNAWHSGYHAGTPTMASNQCQFCHPDASSPGNGIGDTITNPTLHANGVYNVQATFKSTCFNCH